MANLTYRIVRMLVKSLQFPNRAFQLQYSFASFVHLCLQLGWVKDAFTNPNNYSDTHSGLGNSHSRSVHLAHMRFSTLRARPIKATRRDGKTRSYATLDSGAEINVISHHDGSHSECSFPSHFSPARHDRRQRRQQRFFWVHTPLPYIHTLTNAPTNHYHLVRHIHTLL
jgi:hypothetical protein